ncbi:MAG: hypothetical protein AABY73_00805 [Pseudomonadota bacterium]
MKQIILFFAVFFVSGCASQLRVTYQSDPPGAVLYSGGQRVGYTPQTLHYNVTDDVKKRGFVVLADTKVVWASGAAAEAKALKADLTRSGYSQQYMFNRPSNIPGLETDLRFSLDLDRTRALQRQATAQESQAAAQRRQAEAQEESARNESYRVYSPTNCTSTVYGSTVNTSCY